jgi:uncharacterized HAD superfamily protein
MNIAIDLDGVVVDLVGEMLPKLSDLAGHPICHDDIVEFDIGAALRLSTRQMDDLWLWLKKSGSYRRARPIDGAVAAITQLAQMSNADILFVSSRSEELRAETTGWLRSQGLGGFPLVLRPDGLKVVASDEARVLVEDDPRDLPALSGVVESLVLLERPWNREAKLPTNCVRVQAWQDALGAILPLVE